jgi:hypothetical protein
MAEDEVVLAAAVSAGGFLSRWSGFTLTVGRSPAAAVFSLLAWLNTALGGHEENDWSGELSPVLADRVNVGPDPTF